MFVRAESQTPLSELTIAGLSFADGRRNTQTHVLFGEPFILRLPHPNTLQTAHISLCVSVDGRSSVSLSVHLAADAAAVAAVCCETVTPVDVFAGATAISGVAQLDVRLCASRMSAAAGIAALLRWRPPEPVLDVLERASYVTAAEMAPHVCPAVDVLCQILATLPPQQLQSQQLQQQQQQPQPQSRETQLVLSLLSVVADAAASAPYVLHAHIDSSLRAAQFWRPLIAAAVVAINRAAEDVESRSVLRALTLVVQLASGGRAIEIARAMLLLTDLCVPPCLYTANAAVENTHSTNCTISIRYIKEHSLPLPPRDRAGWRSCTSAAV